MFEVGEVYRRSDIHDKYGGQQQGGISTPKEYPFIMLFTGETGEQYGYRDGFQTDGSYWYTGEGQIGDMQYVRGNRAILESNKDNEMIHLFEYVETGMVRYVGEVSYLNHHEKKGPDLNGDLRRIIIFELAQEKIE